jgi:hypothetical protein
VLAREEAQRLVEARIASDAPGEDLAIIESSTIERPFGWVFFYNTREYLQTGGVSAALAGNSPYIVNRFTGALVATGTAHPAAHYLAAYEAFLAASGT